MSLTFASRIHGHERAREMLARLIKTDQVHSSWIFSGPSGIGKRRLANSFAAALNCAASAEARPCEACRSCLLAQAGQHPDLHIVEPSEGRRATTIGEVREALLELSLKPGEGRRRVVIFEAADRLSLDSQNTLLKTLEEPPGQTVLILLAAQPNQLIPTIHSRCQQIRLRPLTQSQVESVLREQSEAPDDIQERARFSGGSPGQALDDEGRLRAQDALLLFEALVDGRLRRDPMALAAELISSLEKKSQGAETRGRLEELGLWLQRGFRDALAWQIHPERPSESLARFLEAPARKLAQTQALQNLRKASEAVDRAVASALRNMNFKLCVEGLIIDLDEAISG